MLKISPPEFEKLNDYYKTYWKYLKEDDLLSAIKIQSEETMKWLSALPEGAENLAYKPGKWMVKEVIGHLSDTERILSYRALRFSRNDKTNLSSFDEDSYVHNSNFGSRSLIDISDEWKTVRAATISLFSSLNEEMLDRTGTSNNVTVTARIVFYFILVHERHHLQVIREKYLTNILSA